MEHRKLDLALAIGGAAGQGIATPGNILARLLAGRGLHVHAYNAYQSIIRGGHIFLTIRTSDRPLGSHGDRLDVLVCLNQDTMDRHLRLMGPGTSVIFNGDRVKPGEAQEGVRLCPVPVHELTGNDPNPALQNTVALGVLMHLLGLDPALLKDSLTRQFGRKGPDVLDPNLRAGLAGFEHARGRFSPLPTPIPRGGTPLGLWSGNDALAMGGAAAGVKFYCAYPMSPSTGVLHWMSRHARELGILVRQVEDEISVANMTIGAAHAGCRAMCATSGGGFALMTEAVGMAGMMEVPVVFIDVQRGGPSTGLPTKTEQADLWQALGASQGEFPRVVVAPTDALDAFRTIPELFNLVDRYQCPGIVLSDLLISEGTFSADPGAIDLHPAIERGETILEGSSPGGYRRYLDTGSGISPRAVPGLEGFEHVVSTDEHDEDGGIISDEFTDPRVRRKMVEKRARKFQDALDRIPAPVLEGPAGAEVTLVCWGSTRGVLREARERLEEEGVACNLLAIKWLVPFHAAAVAAILAAARRTVVVEQNHSGQFARYLRSETGIAAAAHIRKYDGEPLQPHHVVEGVRAILAGSTELHVPDHEIRV